MVEPAELDLKLSHTANNNSFLGVYANPTNRFTAVEADKVANIAESHSIDTIDFLKVGAKGAEPEVLQRVFDDGGLVIRKIVVDCAPERDGESPWVEIQSMLEHGEYTIRTGHGGRVRTQHMTAIANN